MPVFCIFASMPLGFSLFGLDYNTSVVLAGTGLLGAAAGVTGSYAVLRKRALLGDALSHAALPGLCIAFLIFQQRSFPVLLSGAFLTGILGIGVVSFLTRHTRTKQDAAIGIVLSVFFGAGVALLKVIQNVSVEGSKAGLDSFLFGKTSGMVAEDVYGIAGLLLVILLLIMLFYKEFKVLNFDREFAAVQGWPTMALDFLLLGLLAVTTVMGLPAVGVVLMAAMLILPGAAARFWTERLGVMLILSALLGCAAGLVGTLITYFEDLPTGPTIVLVGAAFFLISLTCAPERGVVARSFRRLRLVRKVERQT